MANSTYKVTVTYRDGSPAQIVLIEAINPPQAKRFAEARYGGNACAANQVG